LYRNPLLTVDIIIQMPASGIVLIERQNPPFGWAIPGGFVDYGESLESAAIREASEETGMELVDLRQFHAYSDPNRDPRGHTVSVVFTAVGKGVPQAGDDAKNLRIFSLDMLPENLVFDHALILSHYSEAKNNR
jgi:ADP-ribose pyrophosphatase YjhB (NUDIX family)